MINPGGIYLGFIMGIHRTRQRVTQCAINNTIYQDLKLPMTIMRGVQDWILDVDGHAVWFHKAIPGSELCLVPDTGHMFHYAVPEQVAEVVTATMKRQPMTGGSDRASTPSVVELGHRPAA